MDTASMWARKTSVTGNGNKNTGVQKSAGWRTAVLFKEITALYTKNHTDPTSTVTDCQSNVLCACRSLAFCFP
jgi:hypothetical protein